MIAAALVQAVDCRGEYQVSQKMEVEVAPGRERPHRDPTPGHEEGGPTEDKGQGQAGKVAGRQARTKEVNIDQEVIQNPYSWPQVDEPRMQYFIMNP